MRSIHLSSRMLVVGIGALAMFLLPVVATLVTEPEDLRFQWRMFSRVNATVQYELLEDHRWIPAELTGLGWLDRGRHMGSANLDSLCEVRTEASAARRLHDGRVVAEVRC